MNRHSVPNALNAYLTRPKDGGSNPRFYDFDDGTIRLVKWHPSQHGEKACYNELVASRLAQLIDAPMLRGGIVFVPDDIIPDDHRAFARAGFHFGVIKMKGENFIPATHYDRIDNVTELPTAVVLLRWLQIGDQGGHNQFLEKIVSEDEWALKEIGQRFRIVDAGYMYGSPQWTSKTLQPVSSTFQVPNHLLDHVTNDRIESAIEVLRAVPDEAIRQCFEDVPEEWRIPEEDCRVGADHAIASKQAVGLMKAADIRAGK